MNAVEERSQEDRYATFDCSSRAARWRVACLRTRKLGGGSAAAGGNVYHLSTARAVLEQDSVDPYWMKTITRQGTSPFNPSGSGYMVFRDVTQAPYLAEGDGVTDVRQSFSSFIDRNLSHFVGHGRHQ